MCINSNNNNNNNAVIYKNYRKFQDFILFFKIPVGTRKHFLEIYRHFVHAPSKRFASRGQILHVGFVIAVILKNRDILVGIVTRLRAGTSKELWFDCGQDFLSNSERADPLWGPPGLPFSVYWSISSVCKPARARRWSVSLSSGTVEDGLSYTSAPPHAFVTCAETTLLRL